MNVPIAVADLAVKVKHHLQAVGLNTCCAECATLESIIRLQDARINLLVDQLREAKREQT